MRYSFNRYLYSKVALLKAAYNYTDKAYIHLDADDSYYFVEIEMKPGNDEVTEKGFMNEMLAQAVRHEVYLQTKNIRELLLARALATSVVTSGEDSIIEDNENEFLENEIIKDWFDKDDATFE